MFGYQTGLKPLLIVCAIIYYEGNIFSKSLEGIGEAIILCQAIKLHNAYLKGDLEGVKKALGSPPDFPNCIVPMGFGECLTYAIYHSPLAFIKTLLELGADPNYPDISGFPSLIAALSSERKDKLEILKLLLDYGADVGQRGVNDYTPLHFAASLNDPQLIKLLVAHGADINARTRIDYYATPLEEAEYFGLSRAAEVLRRYEGK
jgi:ankyrin repeat protein